MKKLFILFIIFIPIAVNAVEIDEIIDRQIEQSGVNELEQRLKRVNNNDFSEIIPNFNIKEMTKSLTQGGWSWDISSIMKRAFAFYCKELFVSLKIMLNLIVLCLACALTENLQKSFSKDGLGGVAFFACFFLIAAVSVKAFMNSVSLAATVIDDMIIFINALIPTTLTLLAASGAVVSAGIFHPVLMLSVQAISLAMKNIIMPLILLSTALSIADNVSERNTVGRLSMVFKNAAKWTMGIMLTVFIGIITVQSLAAPAIDGISVKTTKFAVGNFVPVIGSVLAETVDLVFGCSLILKNAVGIAGLFAIVSICSIPIIRLFAQATMFAIASALIEPIADKRIVNILSRISEAITFLVVMVLIVTLMFIINLTIIIGAGNTAAVLGR